MQHLRNQQSVALESWSCHFLAIIVNFVNILRTTLYMSNHQQCFCHDCKRKSHVDTQIIP